MERLSKAQTAEGPVPFTGRRTTIQCPSAMPPDSADLRGRVAIACLIVLTASVYLRSLGEAPVNIGVDEARFAIRAQSIAATGRDIDGTRAPLFFHITDPLHPENGSATWWQPVLFYLMAAVFRFAPFSEWSARLPIAILGILNIWLIYVVARRLFSGASYGVLAAAILALTPAHFLFARQAMDYFCMVTCALAWLWCLILCFQTDGRWAPAVTGAVLGVGLFCHISAWIVMPFYLVVTLSVLWLTHTRRRACRWVLIGFAVPLLPLIPWLWLHPGLPHDMITNYKVASALRLTERVDIYWDYFSPSFLFFSGGSNPMFATRRAGVFLLAAAVLLPCGIWSIARRQYSILGAVVLTAFLFAPAPIVAALPEDPKFYTPRALLLVPFGALISTAGVQWLVRARGWTPRFAAALLILSLPIQFVSFARQYFSEYQLWSASRFDALNLRAVADYVIARDVALRVPAVYLSEDLGEPHAEQWVFYLLAHQRPDLWSRSRHFEVANANPNEIPAGSLLVVDVHHPRLNELLGRVGASVVHVVNDVAGPPASVILRKN